jgi:hypothetical protein
MGRLRDLLLQRVLRARCAVGRVSNWAWNGAGGLGTMHLRVATDLAAIYEPHMLLHLRRAS